MIAAARTVVAFGVVLQFAGFAKLLVIADYFGAGALLDAYYLGLVIPTFVAAVSAGILQTGFVPAYVSARARADDAAAHTLGNFALTWAALALAGVAALLTLMRGAAVPLLAHDASPETRGLLQSVFIPLMWVAPLNGVADSGAILLNAEGRFAAAASAPLLNVIVGMIVLITCADMGVHALVLSLLAGLAVQVLVVLIAIRRAGIRLHLQLTFPLAISRALGGVALPVLISNVLGNLVPAFIQMIAARAGVGAISAMGYASRLHNSLVQAVVMSVSVVLLPHFARLTAEGRTEELRATLERVFAATLLFFAAAVVLVAASGPTVVRILLQHGSFTAANTQLVARVWLALTAGLFGATWGIFLARLFQAQKRPWVIAVACMCLGRCQCFTRVLVPAPVGRCRSCRRKLRRLHPNYVVISRARGPGYGSCFERTHARVFCKGTARERRCLRLGDMVWESLGKHGSSYSRLGADSYCCRSKCPSSADCSATSEHSVCRWDRSRMTSSPLIQVPCPICGSARSIAMWVVKDYLLRVTNDTFGVRRCQTCGAGFLSPRPSPADIARFYPEAFYWSFEQSSTVAITAAQVLERRRSQLTNKLRRLTHLKTGRLLDIGAMKGEFVHVASNEGWGAEGVEFSAGVPNLFDAPIRYGEFLDMGFPAGSFDCVTMWAVLEHVYEPRPYVHEVARVLAPGGAFLGVVTNFNSIQARLLRADDYPRHLTLFTKASLRRLFTEAGLELGTFLDRPEAFWRRSARSTPVQR